MVDETTPIQAFRKVPTSISDPIPIVNIATKLSERPPDKTPDEPDELDQFHVLWSDIKKEFKGASYVTNGNTLVSLLRDNNLAIIKPERVPYIYGVTLSVVVDKTEDATQEEAPSSSASSISTPVIGSQPSPNETTSYAWNNSFDFIEHSDTTLVRDMDYASFIASGSTDASRRIEKQCSRNNSNEVLDRSPDAPNLSTPDASPPQRHMNDSPSILTANLEEIQKSQNLHGHELISPSDVTLSGQGNWAFDPRYQLFEFQLKLKSRDLDIKERTLAQKDEELAIRKEELALAVRIFERDNEKKQGVQPASNTRQLLEEQQRSENEERQREEAERQRAAEVERQRKEAEHQRAVEVELQRQEAERLRLVKEEQERVNLRNLCFQTFLDEASDLNDDPLPRLFIILPRQPSSPNRQFRLFFLCDCGLHTMSKTSDSMPRVHLASNDGYDIRDSDDFITDFGPYVLTMLEMVRYGYATSEIELPSMADADMDKLVTKMPCIDFSNTTLKSLLDDTIVYIRNRIANEPKRLNEAAGWRPLERYLNIGCKTRSCILGNLYRIVTSEGHVRWVCLEHYRDVYSPPTELQAFIEIKGGLFNEALGAMDLKLLQASDARGFVKILTGNGTETQISTEAGITAKTDAGRETGKKEGSERVYNIQNLALVLEWSVTSADLLMLSPVFAKARVVKLHVAINELTKTPLEHEFPNLSLDSKLKAHANRRIQFKNSIFHPNFLMRIARSQAIMEMDTSRMVTATQSFLRILERNSSLTELTLGCYHLPNTFHAIKQLSFKTLKTLVLMSLGLNMIVDVIQGEFKSVEAEVYWNPCGSDSEELEFLKEGHLTKLSVNTVKDYTVLQHSLVQILERNPKLTDIVICGAVQRYYMFIELVSFARNAVQDHDKTIALNQFTLQGEEKRLEVRKNEEDVSMILVLVVKNNVSVNVTDPENGASIRSDLFKDYGWSISSLSTNAKSAHEFASFLSSLDVARVAECTDPKSKADSMTCDPSIDLGKEE
ncbi:hypothetical protein BG011_006149 [Mortierella polycephala]|uniref:Uncharacterized protein n=1 Tax=Mortierella polycephala TaxID=41804 RepID=A0A9P6PTK7_9FUNG|nr:hypothetical protein BG011_006149 [Mortierella polycephala]